MKKVENTKGGKAAADAEEGDPAAGGDGEEAGEEEAGDTEEEGDDDAADAKEEEEGDDAEKASMIKTSMAAALSAMLTAAMY